MTKFLFGIFLIGLAAVASARGGGGGVIGSDSFPLKCTTQLCEGSYNLLKVLQSNRTPTEVKDVIVSIFSGEVGDSYAKVTSNRVMRNSPDESLTCVAVTVKKGSESWLYEITIEIEKNEIGEVLSKNLAYKEPKSTIFAQPLPSRCDYKNCTVYWPDDSYNTVATADKAACLDLYRELKKNNPDTRFKRVEFNNQIIFQP